ncbi:MAG: UDP-N-acetylglucosamine--N-acetylmuramyl-(pentapeptide) pyrophosphoryl-undecaprenol N-acetylglucosamine transferase [Candidatus Altiarchaeota archaeon]|nr:UDP-N-acetylglucosamine--N-acetylmuramyl-(pentapeptide) pyrophosphoryl-undecaprenol N-acetylglucosamine transferase [Candidatus Altiarchaeota archaeon]
MGDSVSGLHIVINGKGLGHNARQRQVADDIKTYLNNQGKHTDIAIITESKILDFWEGFPTFRVPSPHDKMGWGLEKIREVNSQITSNLIKQLEPDYVTMDTYPREVSEKPSDKIFKSMIMRPMTYTRYIEKSKAAEEAWGGFDFVAIPTNEKHENLLDLDPEWSNYFNQIKSGGGNVEHVGRIVPFRKELESLDVNDVKTRMRTKLGYEKDDDVICFAFGGGAFLNSIQGAPLEAEISELASDGFKMHLIAGPYADKEWLKTLRDKHSELTVELNYIEPSTYAKRMLSADLVVSPSGYNTQTTCFFLGIPLVSLNIGGDECRSKWIHLLDEMGATPCVENYNGLSELVSGLSARDLSSMTASARGLIDKNGSKTFARSLSQYGNLI